MNTPTFCSIRIREIQFLRPAFITLLAISFVIGNMGSVQANDLIALWNQLENSASSDLDGDGLPDDLEIASEGEFDLMLPDTNADGIDDMTAFIVNYLSDSAPGAIDDAASSASDAEVAVQDAIDAVNAAIEAQA